MQPLLLLHGAIGSKQQMAPLSKSLEQHFQTHCLNFSGHGGEPLPGQPFSIELFAADVLRYMESKQLGPLPIFGYSMGGYVGMYIARHHPEKITKLITLATKFEWDEPTAAAQQKMFNTVNILEKAPVLAEQLKQAHAPVDWKEVLQRTASMLTVMGTGNPVSSPDRQQVKTPVLLLQGDRDKMVPMEETARIYKELPAAQLGILPGTPHPLEQTDIPILSSMIIRFLS